jgi:hypothetical protein
MPKPTIIIHNTETNEVIEREMTAAEYSNYQASIKISADQDKALADQAVAKAALLERLGITAEEAALLLA